MSIEEALHSVQRLIQKKPSVPLETLAHTLGKKSPLLLILFISLLFSFPLQIPGLSSPFGLLMAGCSLQVMRSRSLWLPQWVRHKKLPSRYLSRVVRGVLWALSFTRYIIYPRWVPFATSTPIRYISGSIMIILGLFLALPLPIPTSNVFSAFPLFCIAFSLLKQDGLALLISYILTVCCFTILLLLIDSGWHIIDHFL